MLFPLKMASSGNSAKELSRVSSLNTLGRISIQLKKNHQLQEDLRMFTKFSYSEPEYFTPCVTQIKNERNDLIMK